MARDCYDTTARYKRPEIKETIALAGQTTATQQQYSMLYDHHSDQHGPSSIRYLDEEEPRRRRWLWCSPQTAPDFAETVWVLAASGDTAECGDTLGTGTVSSLSKSNRPTLSCDAVAPRRFGREAEAAVGRQVWIRDHRRRSLSTDSRIRMRDTSDYIQYLLVCIAHGQQRRDGSWWFKVNH